MRLLLLVLALACSAHAAPPATSIGECGRLLATAPDAATELLSVPLRVSTWNTMKFSRAGSPLVLTALASESDLLLLQESLLENAPGSEHPARLFAPGYASGGVLSGVETRSRVVADVDCTLSFREPWLRTPKAVAVSRYPLEDSEPLLVINLHAINFTLGIAEYTSQMQSVGALLATHRGPALVGGDFNNWSEARANTLLRIMNAQGMAAVEVTPDLRSRHLGYPIDGFFVRGIYSVSATAYPTDASDHHPVTAIFLPALPAPAAANARAPGSAPAAPPR